VRRRSIAAAVREHCAPAVHWNRPRRNCIYRSYSIVCRSKTDSSVFSVEEETGVFENRMDTSVLYDGSDDLHGSRVRVWRPDRIIGLRNNTYFDQYLAAQQSVRHSPFADGNTLYPFLILEAKSAKSCTGFESIEILSAFPIRTLLQLQEKLGNETEGKINPLVWFFACQGDEWRVNVCVRDSAQYVSHQIRPLRPEMC
jgi:hypothetical protein